MPSTGDILKGVGCGDGRSLLNGVRYSTDPPGPTHLPSLDTHLTESSLQRGDMLELQGPSGSGKTALICFMVMTTVLPYKAKLRIPDELLQGGFVRDRKGKGREMDTGEGETRELVLGGRNRRAIYILPSHHPSPIPLLVSSLQSHISHILSPTLSTLPDSTILDTLIQPLIKTALSRITFLRIPPTPNPWAGIQLALLNAGVQIRTNIPGEVGVIAIDGYSDGFWAARWMSEQRKAGGSVGVMKDGGIVGEEDVTQARVLRTLTDLRKDTGAVVLLSTQALFRSKGDAATAGAIWDQHLPSPHPNLYPLPSTPPMRPPPPRTDLWPLTAHLTLSAPNGNALLPNSNSISPFAPEVTLLQAMTTVGQEREAARGVVRWRGVIKVGREGRAGGFDFGMGVGGVEV